MPGNSQITAAEAGVIEVFAPQRSAEYKTLQEQIDEDAAEILSQEGKIRSYQDAIRDLKADNKMRRARRQRNIKKKAIVSRTAFELQMVDEQ
jgi:hypothetical protein